MLSKMHVRQTTRALGGSLKKARQVHELRRSLDGKAGCTTCEAKDKPRKISSRRRASAGVDASGLEPTAEDHDVPAVTHPGADAGHKFCKEFHRGNREVLEQVSLRTALGDFVFESTDPKISAYTGDQGNLDANIADITKKDVNRITYFVSFQGEAQPSMGPVHMVTTHEGAAESFQHWTKPGGLLDRGLQLLANQGEKENVRRALIYLLSQASQLGSSLGGSRRDHPVGLNTGHNPKRALRRHLTKQEDLPDYLWPTNEDPDGFFNLGEGNPDRPAYVDKNGKDHGQCDGEDVRRLGVEPDGMRAWIEIQFKRDSVVVKSKSLQQLRFVPGFRTELEPIDLCALVVQGNYEVTGNPQDFGTATFTVEALDKSDTAQPAQIGPSPELVHGDNLELDKIS